MFHHHSTILATTGLIKQRAVSRQAGKNNSDIGLEDDPHDGVPVAAAPVAALVRAQDVERDVDEAEAEHAYHCCSPRGRGRYAETRDHREWEGHDYIPCPRHKAFRASQMHRQDRAGDGRPKNQHRNHDGDPPEPHERAGRQAEDGAIEDEDRKPDGRQAQQRQCVDGDPEPQIDGTDGGEVVVVRLRFNRRSCCCVVVARIYLHICYGRHRDQRREEDESKAVQSVMELEIPRDCRTDQISACR
ncbi:MAG: hypothetical protein Q9191_001450 [Dirinaria sp. TL-2023a]